MFRICKVAARAVSAGLQQRPMQLNPAFPRYFSNPADSGGAPIAQVVVTALGQDRIGMVSDVTRGVLENGGNVEDSSMARLAGSFCTILLVTLPADRMHSLSETFNAITDMTILVHPTPSESEKPQVRRKYRNLSLTGADNPGLLNSVTSYLASIGANIEKLETVTEEAPFGGTTLFKMDALIGLPISLSDSTLRTDLDGLEQTLGVDFRVEKLS